MYKKRKIKIKQERKSDTDICPIYKYQTRNKLNESEKEGEW